MCISQDIVLIINFFISKELRFIWEGIEIYMGLIRKIYRNTYKIFNYLSNSLIIKINKSNVSKSTEINGIIKIVGDGKKLYIGDYSKINSGKKFNPIGGDTRTIFSLLGGEIKIGNNVGISNSAIIARTGVEIEDDVMIGGGVKIYDTDFHSLNYEDRMARPEIGAKYKPIKIKHGAFIGGHSIILKGVTIGEYSVVGAGSVVTHNIPDKQVWAGNPAKFIKNL